MWVAALREAPGPSVLYYPIVEQEGLGQNL
jgi:hypothetical protein